MVVIHRWGIWPGESKAEIDIEDIEPLEETKSDLKKAFDKIHGFPVAVMTEEEYKEIIRLETEMFETS